MEELDGPTSRRIRRGDITPDALAKGRKLGEDEPPSMNAVRNAEGHGLGLGATQRRNGMGGYEGHLESVAIAKAAVEELQGLIRASHEKATDTLGTVAMAVGENPNVESAQNVVGFVACVQNELNEQLGILNNALAELDRYAGGF